MKMSVWLIPSLAFAICVRSLAAEPPAGPASGPEETFAEPKAGVVTARTLNIRAGPAIDKALITTVGRDRQFKVVGRKDNWFKVELPADIALWVMARFVTLPQGAALPAAGTVNASSVRLRTGGDEKASILRQLDIDTQVEALEKTGDWLKVKAPPGTYGWVHSSYVKIGGEPSTQVAVADPRPPVATEPEKPPTQTPVQPPPQTDPEKQPAAEVVTGPGVETFAEAEAAYRRALAGENPDLVRPFLLYYQAEQTPGAPEQIRRASAQQMARIAPRLSAAQKRQIDDEVRRAREARLAAERARFAEKLARLPRIAPAFDAVGFVDRAPEVRGLPGTHKLSVSGVLLFYLQSAADRVDLERFEGRKVGVIGRRRFVKGWGIEVIDVTEVRDYQDPPGTTIRLEPEPEPEPAPELAPAPAPVLGEDPEDEP